MADAGSSHPESDNDVPLVVDLTRRNFLRLMAIFGGTVATVGWSAILYFFNLGVPDIRIEILLAVICVVLFCSSYLKHIKTVYWSFVIVTFFVVLSFNIFHSDTNPMIYSSITLFPLVALFLLGSLWGGIFSTVYIFILIFVYSFRVTSLSLDSFTIFHIMFHVVTATVIAYFYQSAQKNAQHVVDAKEKEKEKTIEELHLEIVKREQAEEQLKQNITKIESQKKELEKLNSLMVGRELAMADMKRKMKELESQHQ